MPILKDDERIGMIVGGGYRLDRILGRGGMGVVYAATHSRVPQLRSAVKFLNATYAQSAEVVGRFMREAQAAAMLKHPNVVTVTDVGVSADGAPYMMLEYLDGQTLSALLAERGSVSPQEAMTYLSPVMSAVAFAHDSGIIHRDLKPDNLFLSRTGQGHLVPKVLDFGIARLTRDQSRVNGTVAGGVLGTPTYMAPEQAQGENVGPWSDVWSMGVVLFETLSGTLPWDLSGKTDALQVLVTVLSEPPVSLGRVRGGMPSGIVEVVDRALSPDIARRWQHMRELDEAMKSAILRISVTDTIQAVKRPVVVSQATPFVSAYQPPQTVPGQRSLVGPIAGVVGTLGLLAAISYGVMRASDATESATPLADGPPPALPSAPDAGTDAAEIVVVALPTGTDAPPASSDHHHHTHAHTETPPSPTTSVIHGPPSTSVGRSGGLIPLDE